MKFPKINPLWIPLALNLFLLGEYFMDHGNAKNIVFVFWMQSILLGLENIFMMLFARTGMPIMMNNQPSTTSIFSNIFSAGFFMVHYGVFILAFGAIGVFSKQIPGELFHAKWVFPTIIILAIGAILELPGKIMEVRKRSVSLMGLMFIPYLRLIPFVIIIFGGEKLASLWLFPLFLLGKVLVDYIYFRFFNFNQAPQIQN
ncbi:MAG: hypothetical protein KG003_13315 [Bacteroidetes bacterium]|nr:hypothetical protein [Bacteroidota bacterium]